MKDVISFPDWEKVDVRTGTIVEASAPEWSNKLIELHVDFGEEIGERTIFTGMRKWYGPDHFAGKQALFIVNLAPRKMGEKESQGMILSLDTLDSDGNSHPHVIMFESAFPPGTPVS
jgi:methionyl-tRNA synthetase